MEVARRRLEEQEEQKRLLGQASDSEESDSEEEENSTEIPWSQNHYPRVSRLFLVPRLRSGHCPLEGGRPASKGLSHKRVLTPVTPKKKIYLLLERRPVSCLNQPRRMCKSNQATKMTFANLMRYWMSRIRLLMTSGPWEMLCPK